MKIVWRLEKGANRNQSAPTLALPLLSIAMIVMMIFFNSNDRDDDYHYRSHWVVDLLKAMFLYDDNSSMMDYYPHRVDDEDDVYWLPCQLQSMTLFGTGRLFCWHALPIP